MKNDCLLRVARSGVIAPTLSFRNIPRLVFVASEANCDQSNEILYCLLIRGHLHVHLSRCACEFCLELTEPLATATWIAADDLQADFKLRDCRRHGNGCPDRNGWFGRLALPAAF